MQVGVGRLGDIGAVQVSDGDSITSAFRKRGMSKAENEVIQDLNGTTYEGNEEVESGVTYILVQNVKSGQF